MKTAVLAACAAALLAAPASAAPSGRPQGWQTWTWNRTCFAILYPTDESVGPMDSAGAYLAIKHLPSEGNFDAVSVVSGQRQDERLKASIDVDGDVIPMLTFDGAGFVSTGPREAHLLDRLMKGTEAKVTWTTDSGMITQTYALGGLSDAKKIIDMACKPQQTAGK